jgi:hypothetical protein
METIEGYDDIIGKMCKNCGAGPDAIRRRALLCQKCGEAIVDCNSTNVALAEQQKMLFKDVPCTTCGHVAPLRSYDECCGCNNPVRACIFDVDVNIGRMQSTGNSTQLIFSSWSQPHPIDASYKIHPLPLATMYAPDTLETQQKRFNLSLDEVEEADMSEPERPEGGAQRFRNYSANA